MFNLPPPRHISTLPHFEFTHCHGLGVLAHGVSIPPPLSSLLQLPSDGEVAKAVRSVYSRLAATL
jgi:hypothetical protein